MPGRSSWGFVNLASKKWEKRPDVIVAISSLFNHLTRSASQRFNRGELSTGLTLLNISQFLANDAKGKFEPGIVALDIQDQKKKTGNA
jgi:hypothetical protein